MNFFQLYKAALQKYISQAERTHYSLADKPSCPVFIFGWFSWFRHSAIEYPALVELRAILERDKTADQTHARTAIKQHFVDKENKWNNHSFNSYFLDEIQKSCTADEWKTHWEQFDPRPINYFQGLIFRGTGDLPSECFKQGLFEKNESLSLNAYISHMNGSIGVSTSKDFSVALAYALPAIDVRHESLAIWDESYVYLIDYQGDLGIDLQATFKKRDQDICASLSGNKEEVNVIHRIDPQQIIGAFYVNRQDDIHWHVNPNYVFDMNSTVALELKRKLPKRFYQRLEMTGLPTHQAEVTPLLKSAVK